MLRPCRRRIPILATFLLTCLLAPMQAAAPAADPVAPAVAPAAPDDAYTYLENPEMVAEGQEPPHALLRPFADTAAALRGAQQTPWARSLDGQWRLRVVPRPQEVPQGFH